MEVYRETERLPWRPRRFLRSSLRGLLVLVAVCSVWLGIAFQRAREQARAVEIVYAHNGWVFYDYNNGPDFYDEGARSSIPTWLLDSLGEDFFHDVTFVDANEVTDDVLKVICGLREIDALILDESTVTHKGIEHLNVLDKLAVLWIDSPDIDDQALAGIARCRRLRKLFVTNGNIDESAVTNEGIAHLNVLDKLEVLEIDSPHIDDHALAEIARSHKLRELYITNANIGDDGLDNLKLLDSLQNLCLDNTRVSQTGAAALSESLPHCRIYVSGKTGKVFEVKPQRN